VLFLLGWIDVDDVVNVGAIPLHEKVKDEPFQSATQDNGPFMIKKRRCVSILFSGYVGAGYRLSCSGWHRPDCGTSDYGKPAIALPDRVFYVGSLWFRMGGQLVVIAPEGHWLIIRVGVMA